MLRHAGRSLLLTSDIYQRRFASLSADESVVPASDYKTKIESKSCQLKAGETKKCFDITPPMWWRNRQGGFQSCKLHGTSAKKSRAKEDIDLLPIDTRKRTR